VWPITDTWLRSHTLRLIPQTDGRLNIISGGSYNGRDMLHRDVVQMEKQFLESGAHSGFWNSKPGELHTSTSSSLIESIKTRCRENGTKSSNQKIIATCMLGPDAKHYDPAGAEPSSMR
jgi:hypothetical protein